MLLIKGTAYPCADDYLNSNIKECRSIVREEALYLTMLSAVTPTL